MRQSLAILAVLLLTVFSGAARASHYAISDVPRLISSEQVGKLQKAGVTTTEELLGKTARGKDRKALAKASGLSSGDLLVLARRCDLLRIKGVGSEMVHLLQAAGVNSTAELIKRDPASLMTAVTAANKTARISEKPPTEPQLSDWIDQAKRLPQVLETSK